ncbi:MAG: tetratricopeptide repeat protein [Fulvivirga sp.]
MRILLFLTAYLLNFSSFSQDRLSLIIKAEDQLISGDTTEALNTFKNVLEDFPRSFSATKRLSEVYYYLKDYHNAILYVNIAIEIAEDYFFESGEHKNTAQYRLDLADAHHLKGLIRMKQFRFKDALNQVNQALQFDSLNTAIQLDRAMIYFTANDLDSARYYLQSLKSQPEIRSKVLFSIANAYYKEKRLDSALYYYDEVIHYYPIFKAAHHYRGMVLTEMQRYRKAVEAYSTYIQLDSSSEEVFFRRAVLLNELADMTEALKDWSKVIELNNENQEAYRNRGLTYFQLGNYDKAIQDFDKALELEPDQAYTEINRGYSHYLVNDLKQALMDLDNGIKKMPRYYFGYYFRALVHLQLKNRKQACNDAKRAAALGMAESAMDDLVLKKCF